MEQGKHTVEVVKEILEQRKRLLLGRQRPENPSHEKITKDLGFPEEAFLLFIFLTYRS